MRKVFYKYSYRQIHGFTLLEVLIALVVLSIGLLGLMTLQTNSLKFNHASKLHDEATTLAYDILDRMRINKTMAVTTTAYAFDTSSGTITAANCVSSSCTPAQLANYDKGEWKTAIESSLPGGIGKISYVDLPDNTRLYTIKITWKGLGWDSTANTVSRQNDMAIVLNSEV